MIDSSAELVERYAMPAMQAGALFDKCDPLAAALGRAIVAARLVDVARMERASAIAYGPGLEASVRARAASLPVVDLSILWELSSADKLAYARARNVHVIGSTDETSAVKANLWGRSVGRPARNASSDAGYVLTRSARDCPDEPAYLDIDFAAGLPVRVNAIEMPLLEMIESLEIIAGAHGVGRIERWERDADGVATRLAFEAPAAIVLHASHAALERLVIPADLDGLKGDLALVYADLVYQGRWASQTREAIDAFVRTIQPQVTGSVRLKLFKGECEVLGVRSTHAIAVDNAAADAAQSLQPASEGLPA